MILPLRELANRGWCANGHLLGLRPRPMPVQDDRGRGAVSLRPARSAMKGVCVQCKAPMTKQPPGLTSGLAMHAFPPSSLPETPAGRMEQIAQWLQGIPIVDEDGDPTGEYTAPLITKELAARLMDKPGVVVKSGLREGQRTEKE